MQSALEKYRFYLLTVPEEKLQMVTATYSLVPLSNSNTFNSSTENAVIQKVDFEIEQVRYLNYIVRGVNRLSKMERELIYKRYLDDEEVFDYEI